MYTADARTVYRGVRMRIFRRQRPPGSCSQTYSLFPTPPFLPLLEKRENAAFERVGVPAPAPARGAGPARVGGILVY